MQVPLRPPLPGLCRVSLSLSSRLLVVSDRNRRMPRAHLVGERMEGIEPEPTPWRPLILEGRWGHGTDVVLLSFLGEGSQCGEEHLRKVLRWMLAQNTNQNILFT